MSEIYKHRTGQVLDTRTTLYWTEHAMLHLKQATLRLQWLTAFTMQLASSPATYLGPIAEFCLLTCTVATLMLQSL